MTYAIQRLAVRVQLNDRQPPPDQNASVVCRVAFLLRDKCDFRGLQ